MHCRTLGYVARLVFLHGLGFIFLTTLGLVMLKAQLCMMTPRLVITNVLLSFGNITWSSSSFSRVYTAVGFHSRGVLDLLVRHFAAAALSFLGGPTTVSSLLLGMGTWKDSTTA